MRRVALLLGLSAACLVRADDKKEVVHGPNDESVSLAKQDLDQIKRSTAPAGDTAAIVSLQTPDLNTAPSQTYVPDSGSTNLTKAKRGDNWLVDGVMGQKKAEANDVKTLEGALRTKESEREEILKETLDDSAGRTKDSTSSDPKEQLDSKESLKGSAANAKEIETKVTNPLNQFMSSWMSAGDLEVLKPTLASKEGGVVPTDSAASQAANLDLLVAPPSAQAASTSSPLAKASENPFVEFMNDPAVAPVQQTVYSPPPAPAPEAIPPPALVPESKGIVPDFAKGLHDDPAFKQAKRF